MDILKINKILVICYFIENYSIVWGIKKKKYVKINNFFNK